MPSTLIEFRSELESILEAEELLFEPASAFGQYKPYLSHAISHPAKMNVNLLEFLIKKFTKEGDVILDPMAGSGSMGVVASLNGRNAIQVELEQKFYEWMEKARENIEKGQTLTPKGDIRNICGDSRKLSELLGVKADSIITSPPYSNIAKSKEGAISPHMQGLISKLSGIPVKEFAHDVEKLKEAVKIAQSKIPFQYSNNPDNIGNLPLGTIIDTIITSPPYGEAQNGHGIAKEGYRGKKHSPTDLVGKCSYMPDKFEDKNNISRFPFGNIDVVITSPPYSEGIGHGGKRRTKILTRDKGIWCQGKGSYSENVENIGEMRSETYLEAMMKVYMAMWKILKPEGLAIIVIKPFIKNKKVVDLPYQTYLLMKKAGFEISQLYKLRLKNQSFWRIIFYKKYPDVPRINHEWILVMRRA